MNKETKKYGVNLQKDIRVSTSVGDARALRCSYHKGTDGPLCRLVFLLTSVIITGFGSVRLILGHCNENLVVLKHDNEFNFYIKIINFNACHKKS